MLRGRFAPLARTTGNVLVAPTLTLPKFAMMGYTTIDVIVPIPVSDAVCGALVALSAMVSVPVSENGWLGVKYTWIVQLLCDARLAPQLFVCVKAGSSMVMPEIRSDATLPFVSVTFCARPLLPI